MKCKYWVLKHKIWSTKISVNHNEYKYSVLEDENMLFRVVKKSSLLLNHTFL